MNHANNKSAGNAIVESGHEESMPLEIEDIPFFHDLSSAELAAVKACLIQEKFKKGAIVHQEGGECTSVFFVKAGRIKVYRTLYQGKKQTYEILGPGDTCACNPGELFWKCGSSAEVLEDSTLWFLSRELYIEMVRNNPKLMHALNNLFAKRLQCFGNIIEDEAQKEKELRELNVALEKNATKLQSSNKELEQFASVASHDLQEPFHIISSFMGLLASGYKDKLEPRAQDLIKIAEDAAGRAQELIRSLLDYARVDTGERTLEIVDMKSVVHQVLSDLRRQVEESSVEIICDPLPKIMGDPVHLTRLFQNLISNAIKYRSEHPLQIHISARKENVDWIFQIKDNGVGFDPKNKARVFEMFKRLQGREISGVGIGLATCKKIVERHGGKIWAESRPGKGATFYFSIPDQMDNPEKGRV